MPDLFDLKTDFGSALEPVPLTEKDPDDFTVVIEGVPIRVINGRVIRAMDNVVDGWSGLVRWDPSNAAQSDLLRPYGYQKAECYLGKDIVINGLMPNTASKGSANGTFKKLSGFSLPVDIIDDNVKPPYEQTNITLEERARTLTEAYPFKVVYDAPNDEPFDRITSNPDDKIFAHLLPLAQQRGTLITSTTFGELLFTVANTEGEPVDTIADDFPPGTEYEINFDGRNRFYEHRARAQSPGRRKRSKAKLKTASAFDKTAPTHRFHTFAADEASLGNLQTAADWERSKSIAKALTIPYPVSGWYDSKGNLWKENTIVTVKSNVLHVPDGYNFLIRQVEYLFKANGTSAILGLVPPQAYTGKPIVEPWSS
jgi:prophage tail gpP-like protein